MNSYITNFIYVIELQKISFPAIVTQNDGFPNMLGYNDPVFLKG